MVISRGLQASKAAISALPGVVANQQKQGVRANQADRKK